jgi:hypothetical protein
LIAGVDDVRRVAVKAGADLVEQGVSGLEIDSGAVDVDMAHVGGQYRQQGIYVCPVLVPAEQTVDGVAVP